MFFATFTVTRMVWAPYLLYLGYLDVFAAWNLRTNFQTGCAIVSLTEASMVLILNIFWFYLILDGLKRLL